MSYDMRRALAVSLLSIGLVLGLSVAGVPGLISDEPAVQPAVQDAEAAAPLVALAVIGGAGLAGGAAAYAVEQLENAPAIDTDDAGSQVESDTYSHADTLRKAQADKGTASDNFAKIQEGTMMTDAKLAMIRTYNDGGGESQMVLAGKEVVNNKTAKMEAELVSSGNFYLAKIWSLRNSHVNSAAGNDTLYLDNNQGATADLSNGHYYEPGELPPEWHYQLANGTQMPVAVISDDDLTTDTWSNGSCGVCASLDWNSSSSTGDSDIIHRTPDGLDSNDFPEITAWDDSELDVPLANTRSRADTVKNQLSDMASEITANFSRGEVTVGNLTGPYERAVALGSQYNETGDDKYLNAMLREAGHDSAVDYSFTLELHNDSKTVDADLYQDAWTTVHNNTTYYPTTEVNDTSNISDTQLWNPSQESVVIETSSVRALEQNFTVVGITNATGAELDNTTYQSNDWETNNVSTLQDQLDKLADFQESLTLDDGTASSGSGLGSTGIAAIVAVLAGGYLVAGGGGGSLLGGSGGRGGRGR